MSGLLNENQIVATFLELARIDNPSLGERQMADAVLGKLRSLGLKPQEDDSYLAAKGTAGNIYAFYPGSAGREAEAPLLFSGHLDSVEPASGKQPQVRDGRITSDGTTVLGADDLAGLTAVLEAIRFIESEGLSHRPIEILFTYGEELYDVGSEHFDFSKIRAKEAYVLDNDGPIGNFIYQAPSIISFTAEIKGKAAHAGFQPEAGVHAISIAAEAVDKLKMGRVTPDLTVNIGTIQGGTGTNIVPATCTVKGEIRGNVHEQAMAQLAYIEQTFRAAAQKRSGKLEFSSRIGCYAYQTDLDSNVVNRYQSVCRELGVEAQPRQSFGGSDNNRFCQQGIIGIVLSCGMNNVHSVHEYLDISDLVKSTEIVVKMMATDI